jgi:predicted ArsR family transcriptional regulator
MRDDLPELPPIPEEVLVSDPSQFEALSSSVRMRILSTCHIPRSVREIAEDLDVPVTRLYYHVNLLDDCGFLEVVHTRKSGARLEKLYRATGRRITPGPDLLDNVDDPGAAARIMAAIVFEPARAETERALERRLEGEGQSANFGRAISRLTPAQLEEVTSRLEDLVGSFVGEDDHDDEAAREYTFTFTLVPTEQ